MLEARLLGFDERGGGHEDLLAVLQSAHQTRAVGSAITQPLDAILDRRVRVAQAQEINMQRVRERFRSAARSGDECLGRDVTAEQATSRAAGSDAAIGVSGDRLEIEPLEKMNERLIHGTSLERRVRLRQWR